MKKAKRRSRIRSAVEELNCTEVIRGRLDDRYEIPLEKKGGDLPPSPLWDFEKLAFRELCERLSAGDFVGCHEIIGLLSAASLI